MIKLYCTDTDPKHIHDEGECCECGSRSHCCGACPVFVPNDPNRPPDEWWFRVKVIGCTSEQANKVMAERIDYDEDYGFEYTIKWEDT